MPDIYTKTAMNLRIHKLDNSELSAGSSRAYLLISDGHAIYYTTQYSITFRVTSLSKIFNVSFIANSLTVDGTTATIYHDGAHRVEVEKKSTYDYWITLWDATTNTQIDLANDTSNLSGGRLVYLS